MENPLASVPISSPLPASCNWPSVKTAISRILGICIGMPGMRYVAFLTPMIHNLTDPCNKPTGLVGPQVCSSSISHQSASHCGKIENAYKTPSVTNVFGLNLATPGVIGGLIPFNYVKAVSISPAPEAPGAFGAPALAPAPLPEAASEASDQAWQTWELYKSCRKNEGKSFAKHASNMEWLENPGTQEVCRSLLSIVKL